MRYVDLYQKRRIDESGLTINERYQFSKLEKRSTLSQPDSWLMEAFQSQFGASNHSGKAVNEKTAISIAAVHACVEVISSTLGSMPLKLYVTDGNKRVVDRESKVALLLDEPNPFTTGVTFRKYMIARAVYTGNSYAYIFRDGLGQVKNLLPLQNCSVKPLIGLTGLYYQITTTDPLYKDIPSIVSSYDMLHFKGLCLDNQFMGINPIIRHAESLGMDLAAMASMSAAFKSGTKKWMLNSDRPWDVPQQKATKESMESMLSGDGLVFAVPSGIAAQTISMTPVEAGYIDALNLSNKDIARIFGVPASMIGADDGAIKASTEQDYLTFQSNTLNAWAVGIEAELKMKLLSEKDKPKKYFKHNFNSLLRADAVARSQYYSIMFNDGLMSPNEIRDLEESNPYEGGETYYVNANLVPTSQMNPWIQAKIDSMNMKQQKTNNPDGNN